MISSVLGRLRTPATPPEADGSLTIDFAWSSSVVTILSCCNKPAPMVGAEVTARPQGLTLDEGERAWWLGCSNCGHDIAALVWTAGKEGDE